MKFKLTTKTPVFTGDIDKESQTIRETSLIGSMRWWYEAIVRSLGGYACDPTGEGCPTQDGQWCDACHLFGTTKWARQFIIRVAPGSMRSMPSNRIRVPLTTKGWFLPPGRHGEFGLTIQGLRGNQVDKWIRLLLQLQSNWGAIGARSYLGYGVFHLEDESENPVTVTETDCREISDFVTQARETRRPSFNMTGLPNLTQMFFCKITLELQSRRPPDIDKIPYNTLNGCFRNNFLPTAAHVRYCLRNLFRGTGSSHYDENSRCGDRCRYCFDYKVSPLNELPDSDVSEFRHHMLGKPGQDEKEGGKIAVSHLYKIDDRHWQMRIWGQIPTQVPQVEYKYTSGEFYTGVNAILQFLRDAFDDAYFWENCLGCTMNISNFECFYGDLYEKKPLDLLYQFVSD